MQELPTRHRTCSAVKQVACMFWQISRHSLPKRGPKPSRLMTSDACMQFCSLWMWLCLLRPCPCFAHISNHAHFSNHAHIPPTWQVQHSIELILCRDVQKVYCSIRTNGRQAVFWELRHMAADHMQAHLMILGGRVTGCCSSNKACHAIYFYRGIPSSILNIWINMIQI